MHEMNNDVRRVIDGYIATWNETNPERRRAMLREVCAEDCAYTDPKVEAKGLDQLEGFIAAVQQQFPGVVFSLGGTVDSHHEQARFTWHAGPPGSKEPLAIGFDVVALERGRIRRVYGFIDKAP